MSTPKETPAERAVLAWCRNRDRKGYHGGCPVMRENDAYGPAYRCIVIDVYRNDPTWIDPKSPAYMPRAMKPAEGGVPSKAHIASGPSWEAVAAALGIEV